jgi:MEMO1 family protein
MVPFLQYYNRKVQIVSILVPYMSFGRMDSISKALAASINKALQKNKLEWGKDVAIVISNDAVHYGDTDWGGRNFARYGADSAGYKKAVEFERALISSTLEGDLSPGKIKEFNTNTVSEKDHHEYKWTWCGRYSVPFGLLTSFYLNEKNKIPLRGKSFGYSTSLQNSHIPVSDLGIG